jgi:hypothetical protein
MHTQNQENADDYEQQQQQQQSHFSMKKSKQQQPHKTPLLLTPSSSSSSSSSLHKLTAEIKTVPWMQTLQEKVEADMGHHYQPSFLSRSGNRTSYDSHMETPSTLRAPQPVPAGAGATVGPSTGTHWSEGSSKPIVTLSLSKNNSHHDLHEVTQTQTLSAAAALTARREFLLSKYGNGSNGHLNHGDVRQSGPPPTSTTTTAGPAEAVATSDHDMSRDVGNGLSSTAAPPASSSSTHQHHHPSTKDLTPSSTNIPWHGSNERLQSILTKYKVATTASNTPPRPQVSSLSSSSTSSSLSSSSTTTSLSSSSLLSSSSVAPPTATKACASQTKNDDHAENRTTQALLAKYLRT